MGAGAFPEPFNRFHLSSVLKWEPGGKEEKEEKEERGRWEVEEEEEEEEERLPRR